MVSDKTVLISTYCVPSSFGSICQAVGLKSILEELGYKSIVVQTEMPLCREYKISHEKRGLKNEIVFLLKKLVQKKLQIKHLNTCKFIEENIDMRYYDNVNVMREALKHEQFFLAGSDQIWNPNKLAPEFFLDFAPLEAKKLSYAASMGTLEVPENKREVFKQLLGNFDNLSVREKDNVPVVAMYTGKTVDVHIDPSFFCSRDQWKMMQKPYPIEKPYVLVYPLYWDRSLNDRLRELHLKTGKDIIVIDNYYRNIYANKWIFDADIANFLWLIDNADAVVTSSFHGVALSINYNKTVIPVINPSAPSRITCLLELLKYPRVTVEMLMEDVTIDFVNINRCISMETERGMEYLKEILKS